MMNIHVKEHACDKNESGQTVVLEITWLEYRLCLGWQSEQRFGPLSFRVNGEEILSEYQPAWYEFRLEGRKVSQALGEWCYEGCEQRAMANGGQEITLRIRGKERNRGIEVLAQIQVTNQAVMRQRFLLLPCQDHPPLRMEYDNGRPDMTLCGISLARAHYARAEYEAIRLATWQDNDYFHAGSGRLSDDHAYFPCSLHANKDEILEDKGPVLLVASDDEGSAGALLAYEHGSWDNDPDEDYFHVHATPKPQGLELSVRAFEPGSYLPGEVLEHDRPYASVWCDLGVFKAIKPREALFDFIHGGIAEHMASRRPIVYYNTWGDQWEAARRGEGYTDRVCEETILRHMQYASEMGVTHFVVDYGWQQDFGDWRINRQKFPGGIEKLVETCNNLGMELGVWMEPLSLNCEGEYCRYQPEGLVLGADGKPRQVNHLNQTIHFGCLSSSFFDYLQQMHFNLIDKGVRFFKWDWIEPDACCSSQHDHGDDSNPPDLRRRRAMFRSIEQLTTLAQSLNDKHQDCIVEFDVTEARRQVGLGFLAASKYWWYNFGSQDERDPMGMLWLPRERRKQPAHYGGFLPSILFNASNNAVSCQGTRIMRYNIHSSLVGSGGLWGNLDEVKDYDRREIGFIMESFKQLGDCITRAPLRMTGKPGQTPEVYELLRDNAGVVVSFCQSALAFSHQTQRIDVDALFIVSETPYHINEHGCVNLEFDLADWSSAHAFVYDHGHAVNLPAGVSVLSSTRGVWRWEIEDAVLRLFPYPGNESTFSIAMPEDSGFRLHQGKALAQEEKKFGRKCISVSNIALSPLEIEFL